MEIISWNNAILFHKYLNGNFNSIDTSRALVAVKVETEVETFKI